jgi:hypothetical protein
LNINVGAEVEVLGFTLIITLEWTQAFGSSLFQTLYNADVAHDILANTAHPWIMWKFHANLTQEVVSGEF